MSGDLQQQWYAGGVQFECQPGCVRCCGGEPGDIFVTDEDITRIAEYLKVDRQTFDAQNVRHYSSGRMSLTEQRNGDCVLLSAKGCTAYDVRPKQCRDYPFWPEVMRSRRHWTREAGRCPGLNVGPVHEAFKITNLLKSQL